VSLPIVLVDGERTAGVPATDSSVLRGDGCFEAIRAYAGKPFRADAHLDRLERSAAALDLPVPDRSLIASWIREVAEEGGDCLVRVVVTRGPAVPGVEGSGRCIVMAHDLPPRRTETTLWPVVAPWHSAGTWWSLTGAKTISYAPNLAAGREAQKHGADDALLVSVGGVVLEGPTFSVGWCRDGRVFTPGLDLGILDSITRRVILEIRPDIAEVTETLDRVLEADEVFVMSTTQEILPVVGVGDRRFPPGPITAEIAQRFTELVGQ